jgi:cysteine desulfurase
MHYRFWAFIAQALTGRRRVYLDSNATTPPSRKVRQAMARAAKYCWGNPSAAYAEGKKSAQLIEKARRQVAQAINAHEHEVYFASSATEWNNALLKTLYHNSAQPRRKIISTRAEHSSVSRSLAYLAAHGADIAYCPIDRHGHIILAELGQLIDSSTLLVCCALANNETGAVQPMAEISKLAKTHGALLMSDCVQALGKIDVDVKALGLDYAVFSAHKLYGPKGAAALYAKITSPLEAFIHGGGQEEGIRAGTEAVPNIAGMGRACSNAKRLAGRAAKTELLKNELARKLMEIEPAIKFNSPSANCLPNTINITFPGTKSTELMLMLDYYGIAVSAGSACGAQPGKTSHVLSAIGLSDAEAASTLRISLSSTTSRADISYLCKKLEAYLKQARS